MTVKIIVANDKGGVGKSTVAQFCAVALKRRHGTIHIAEYDGQHRLKRFFEADEVTPVTVFPDWRTRMTDPARQTEIWDPLLEWLDDGRPTVIDLGAQMWDGFLAWAEATTPADILDPSQILVLTPFTADLEAIVGAQRVAEGLARALPGARLVALACDKDGDTALFRTTPHHRALDRAVSEANGEIRAFPVMIREGYPALAAQGFRFDRIVESRPKEIASASGLPPAIAARTISALRSWLDAAERSLDGLFDAPSMDVVAEPPPPLPPAAVRAEAPPVSVSAAAPPPPASPPAARPPVFDEAAYLSLYPDVAQAVAQGLYPSGYQHYLERGVREGRAAPSRPA